MPLEPSAALESKVAFLRQPSSFPEKTYRVEAIETHMSWVFLTEQYAYKLKKPVCYEFLDFREVSARRYFCEEEIRLNRRLAANVYIGIITLSMNATGHMQLGNAGQTVDWLVKMRRLPTDRMLDYAIKNKTASTADIRHVATKLSHFYLQCNAIDLTADSYRAAFIHSMERIWQQLIRPFYQLPLTRINRICRALLAAVTQKSVLFDERVHNRKIVEGHGDLRPEHIYVGEDIEIIDCLEFSKELRIIDPVDELGFLALECERLDAPDLGMILLHAYSELTKDLPNPSLLHFYQSYRAMLRALIAIRHLNEEKFRYSAEWHSRAARYLDLAEQHQASINSVIEPPQ